MLISKIEVLRFGASDDLIRMITDLPDAWNENAVAKFEMFVPKNQGVKYVFDHILPGCATNPEFIVLDVKTRILEYPIELGEHE